MRITNTGNIGIQKTTPQAPLDVVGEVIIGSSTGLTCDSNRAGGLRYNSANSCIEFCDSTTWTCITPSTCPDTTPDAFSIPDVSGVSISTVTESSIVQITGLGCAVNIQAYGEGSPQIKVCSDSGCSTIVQDWTSGATSISSGQYIQVRAT